MRTMRPVRGDVMEKLVETIRKNASEEIRISLSEWEGHDLVNIRVWMTPYEGGERRPTKKGIACKVALLPEIIAALQAAESEARKAGLLGKKDAAA